MGTGPRSRQVPLGLAFPGQHKRRLGFGANPSRLLVDAEHAPQAREALDGLLATSTR